MMEMLTVKYGASNPEILLEKIVLDHFTMLFDDNEQIHMSRRIKRREFEEESGAAKPIGQSDSPKDECPSGRVMDNPNNLEEARCGFANDPTHKPHEMEITGVWPRGVPNRWCVGFRYTIQDEDDGDHRDRRLAEEIEEDKKTYPKLIGHLTPEQKKEIDRRVRESFYPGSFGNPTLQ